MLTETKIHRIIEKRELTPSTFILRFDRHGINFQAGQHILVGISEEDEMREYSIYSGEHDDYLEILVREVEDGMVSKQLKNLKPGDSIQVEGAVGFFRLNQDLRDKKLLFISSGTGIAPFHSFVKSYPKLDYYLLHGIRYANEQYESGHYEPERYISCITRENGNYHGRVTDYLKEKPTQDDTMVFLCGNSNMILEAKDILESQSVPNENIHTEVYF